MSEYNTNQDGQWKTSDQWRAEEANDHSNPKKNKNGGRGKYVAKLAASAVAFGLIAGLVMQGQPIYDAYQSLLPKAEGFFLFLSKGGHHGYFSECPRADRRPGPPDHHFL